MQGGVGRPGGKIELGLETVSVWHVLDLGMSKNRVYHYTPNCLAIECRENDVLIQYIFRQTHVGETA